MPKNYRGPIEISEEELPGIGVRDDFLTEKNRRVGVITYRDGRRELLVYAKGDPDSCSETVSLTSEEADILAEYLGTRRVVERLSKVSEQVESIQTSSITVLPGSPLVGVTLGEAQIRAKTGASVVAVKRGSHMTASPSADFRIRLSDEFITVGTAESIVAATEVVNGI